MKVPSAKRMEVWPVEDLKPYENNARVHSADQVNQIEQSIRRFGFNAPILVDSEAGIIAGHGRLLAAKNLGLTEVPVIELTHLSDEDKRAYIIADNKIGDNSWFDEETLAAELRSLEDVDFDLSVTGFSDDELAELLAGADEEPPGAHSTRPPTTRTTMSSGERNAL